MPADVAAGHCGLTVAFEFYRLRLATRLVVAAVLVLFFSVLALAVLLVFQTERGDEADLASD